MEASRLSGIGVRSKAQIRQELRVFAWNLRSLNTPFARRSLALNAIEKGRAWHWRLLPAGWVDPSFILQHGQVKTKQAFAIFFRSSEPIAIQPPKRIMKVKNPPAGEAPLNWDTVKTAFKQNPKLKRLGVLAGAQALLNEHLENRFGRYSFDIDLHTPKEVEQVDALLTPDDRKRIQLVSRANSEMYVYEVHTSFGRVKLEIAKPYLTPKQAPRGSKYIPGLKVTQFADLIDAKISALSTRGFARDFVDIYAAHQQRHLDWRGLLLRASRNQQNDYNPVELENRLHLLEQEFRAGTQEIPCERPPAINELTAFLEELRAVNADVARDLTKFENDLGDKEGIE